MEAKTVGTRAFWSDDLTLLAFYAESRADPAHIFSGVRDTQTSTQSSIQVDTAGLTLPPAPVSCGSESASFDGIQTLSATGGKHLKVTWTATSTLNVDRYKIFVSTSEGNFDFSTPQAIVMGRKKCTVSLSGLADNTTYHVVVRAWGPGYTDSNTVELGATTIQKYVLPMTSNSAATFQAIANYHSHSKDSIAVGEIATVAGANLYGWEKDGSLPIAKGAEHSGCNDVVWMPDNGYLVACGNKIMRADSLGNLSTFAGTGVTGFSGDGGQANEAMFEGIMDLALSPTGEVYVASPGRLRKISTSGTVTTIAGNGTLGITGDGEQATGALLHYVYGVAVDQSGAVYVSQRNVRTIRKISTDGKIDLFAGGGVANYGDGGPATEAQLSQPVKLTVDRNGNVLITDQYLYSVRKVNTAGVISTIAGQPNLYLPSGDGGPATQAGIMMPTDIVTDSAGNIFIATWSYASPSVRKIDTNGLISTYAGYNQEAISTNVTGENGPATAANLGYALTSLSIDSLGNLYMTPQFQGMVLKVSTSGFLTTEFGKIKAGYRGDGQNAVVSTLSSPVNLALDSMGRLLIADQTNYRIRRIETNGTISTFAGTGTNSFAGSCAQSSSCSIMSPYGLSIDKEGNTYAGSGYRMIRISTSNSVTTLLGNGTYGFSADGVNSTTAPGGLVSRIVVNSDGTILFLESTSNRIRKFATNGMVTTLAGNGSAGFAADGSIASSNPLQYPSELILNSKGEPVFVEGARVRRVDSNGVLSTIAGTGTLGYSADGTAATEASFSSITALAYDSLGNLYLAGNYALRKISTSGALSTVFGTGTYGISGDGGSASAANVNITDFVFDKDGNIYFSDSASHRVRFVKLK